MTESRFPPSAWRRVALLLFVVGWGANHFGALLLVYGVRLALDPAALALLFGIYALGLIPGLLLSGPLSDRHGRRALVLPAAAAALVASALLGAGGSSFVALLLGRLGYGLAAGGVMSAGAVWMLELSAAAGAGVGARRATIALSAGFGLGPLFSGLLAQFAPAPTILPFVGHVAALVVALVVAAGAPQAPPRTTSIARVPFLQRIGLDRANRRGFVTGVLPMAPFVFVFPAIAFAVIPEILGSHALGRAPIAYTGLIGCVTLVSGALAQPLTLRFAPTTGARVGLVIGASGAAIGALAIVSNEPALLLVTAATLGVGYGVCMTSGLRQVELLASPETRGGLVGLYYVVTYLGFATPYLLARAVRTIPAHLALLGVAALALLVAVTLQRPVRLDR
ncbi:MAG: MFS transporter [Proteobacteria bacterium]|nr:MFS transporter [Pseudomonadota bacterium]